MIYDGTHYNLGVHKDGAGEARRTFPVAEECDEKWLEFAKVLKDSGQYIDPNLFALKCCDCGAPLQGQVEAMMHAQEFKHANFSQVEGADIFNGM